jgi:anti-sigma B factor antagonist
MKMETQGNTLRIVAVKELGATNANAFRDWVRKALADGLRNIEIDLSQTTFLDSCGLGALVALHKTVCGRHGQLRLLHPQPPVLQILELTRMHRLFEIVKS